MRYIVLLRGINVSGKNKLKMADLRAMLEAMNFGNVQTYIQSGNIIFEHPKTPSSTLEERIKGQLMERFGYDIPVLALTVDELKDIFNHNPFLTKRNEDIAKLYVTILKEKPDNERVSVVKEIEYKTDEFEMRDKLIYVFSPGGYGRTKFTNNFFEAKLKVQATTRNWKTITKLVEMSNESS